MTATCINLKERFGKKYRIGFDEAYDHAHVPKDKLDPWAMTIPCRLGTIYPQGGEMLAVEIDHHNPTAKRVEAIPGVVLHQIGEFEKTYLFPVGLFDQVAGIVIPKRRRVLTEDQKAKAVERLAKYRFSPADPADNGEKPGQIPALTPVGGQLGQEKDPGGKATSDASLGVGVA